MRRPSTLPTASPKTVLEVFRLLFTAAPDQVFTQKTLRQLGIRQNRPALTLLHFLSMSSPSGRLEEDVQECRGDPDRFTELARTRLKTACVEIGCDPETIGELGSQKLPDDRVKALIESLKPIKSQESKTVVCNMVSAIRTLHDLLARRCDRGWLEAELRALETRKARSGSEGRRRRSAHDSFSISDDRLLLSRNMGGHLAACKGDVRELLQRILDLPESTDGTLEAEWVPVGFDGEIAIKAYVVRPADMTPIEFRRLARHFLEKAEEREESGEPAALGIAANEPSL